MCHLYVDYVGFMMKHIVTACPKLAQKVYQNAMHDNVANVIHRTIFVLLSRFSFSNIHDSQDNKPMGRLPL